MSQLPGFSIWNNELKGIISIQKDEHGVAGIHIPDCFSINNLVEDVGSQKATGRNLLMEYPHSNILYKDNIYSLRSTGQTETISIIGQELIMESYTCKEYPDALFLWNGNIGLLLGATGTKPFLWKEDHFQFSSMVDGEKDIPLDGLINISEIQNPENLYPPIMFNCFNDTLTIPNQMIISGESYMQKVALFNSFNNIQNEIWINFYDAKNYDFEIFDITTCFGGTTHGFVMFSEAVLQDLVEQKKITPVEEGSTVYSLNHNPKVFLSSVDIKKIGDLL